MLFSSQLATLVDWLTFHIDLKRGLGAVSLLFNPLVEGVLSKEAKSTKHKEGKLRDDLQIKILLLFLIMQ